MNYSFRRLPGRLFYCLISLLLAARLAHATGPATTTVSEALFGHNSSSDKKDAALSFASAAIGLADAVASREVMDADKFREGLGKVIDGVVECLNASAWARAK